MNPKFWETYLSKLLKQKTKLWKYYLIFLSFLLILAFVISVRIGYLHVSYVEIFQILLRKMFPWFNLDTALEVRKAEEYVIWNFRFPRAFMSMLVGAALAASGCIFQAIFKNPLADPYIIGVSSGAALGAAVAIILGLSISFPGVSGIASTAFIGALVTLFIVYRLATTGGRVSVTTLLLAGVIVGIFFSAILSILMVFSGWELHVLIFWLMGGFSHIRWPYVITSTPIILTCLILTFFLARNLNLLLLSEEEAQYLGLDVFKAIKVFLVLGAFMTAIAVSCSGCIGFVGLVVPHIMRILLGPDHRILLPSSILAGASLLTLCDVMARVIFPPIELPVGVVTALIGAPFFLYLLHKRREIYIF